MRIRVLSTFRAYWNYAIQEFRKGEEHLGGLARHLADNAPEGAVEVLEDDRPAEGAQTPEEPAGEQTPSSDQGDQGSGDGQPADGAPGDDQGDENASADGEQPPVDGTIDTLMAWIGDDRERAARALEAEQAKDKPRSTVVKRLSAIAE